VPAPLVSVVVPSYNQGRWIDACLRSLVDQRDPKLEIIVVDGGSTDGTSEALMRWRPALAHCIVEPDDGQADAIAKGFALARGEILAWLNSDDMHLPWTIARWREAFARDARIGLVHGDRVVIDADGMVAGYRCLPPLGRSWLSRWPWTHQETAAWRRGLYDRVGGIDRSLRFAMDYDLFARFFRTARCAHVRAPLGAFRWHAASKSAMLQSTLGAEEVSLVRARHGIRAASRAHPLRIATSAAVRAATALHALRAHRADGRPTRTGFDIAELW
jgi:glycosyltransferase involved in cell wall biosynthesis